MKKRKRRERFLIPTVIFLWGKPDVSDNFRHLADIWRRNEPDADKQAMDFVHTLSEDEQVALVEESLAMQQHREIANRIIQQLPEQFSKN